MIYCVQNFGKITIINSFDYHIPCFDKVNSTRVLMHIYAFILSLLFLWKKTDFNLVPFFVLQTNSCTNDGI